MCVRVFGCVVCVCVCVCCHVRVGQIGFRAAAQTVSNRFTTVSLSNCNSGALALKMWGSLWKSALEHAKQSVKIMKLAAVT